MADPGDKIISMLTAIRRRWTLRSVALYLIVGAAAALVWLLVTVVLDNILALRPWQLFVAWVIAATALAAGIAWALWALTAARPTAGELALMYERQASGNENRLANAVHFLLTGLAQTHPLAYAAVQENAAALEHSSASVAVDFRAPRIAGMWLLSCALLMGIYSGARPQIVCNALLRLLHPLSPPAHLLTTAITVSPGDAAVPEGEGVRIEAKMDRHVPDQAALEYRIEGAGWIKVQMDRAGRDSFSYDGLRSLWKSLDYRLIAGRATSQTYRVTVLPRPKVTRLRLTVTPPAYTALPARTLPDGTGDVTAVRGSSVRIEVESSSLLSRASLQMNDGTNIPLTVAKDGLRAAAAFALAKSATYAIVLMDRSHPQPLTSDTTRRYMLIAQDDQPPSASISSPGRDLILPPDTTLELRVDAEDDFGLASVAIETQSPKGQWTKLEDATFPAPGEKRKTLRPRLALASFNLKTGDTLLYRACASDHCQPKPNTFAGKSWSITVGTQSDDPSLLAPELKKLLDSLQGILALQKEARGDVDLDRPVEPIRTKQKKVREMTLVVVDQQRQAMRPMQAIIDGLTQLADGPMPQASRLLENFGGTYPQRATLKPPILKVMDQIIARLEDLAGQVSRALAQADAAKAALAKLPPEKREEALKQLRDLLEKLRAFTTEQDKVIQDTEELVRKAPNFTPEELQKIDQLKGTEDSWAKVFAASVKDIQKLLEQGFADSTIANDYKEMVEQIEESAKNLNPQIKEIVVPREQTALELATELKEDMEMWLPNTPDDKKWVMEEPLDHPDVPMPPLPENLRDMIGDLIAQENEMTQAADDKTSSWADSMSAAGGEASDGPISNFSAVGITGNQLPNDNEISGRAGDGRSGRSQGQMVEDVAKGLEGRKTPARVTNDAYEKGVVKELQQMATGGATGGGKARGAGQEGLQGQSMPPNYKQLGFMKDWQQRIRQSAEQLAGQLKSVHIRVKDLDKGIATMKQAEAAAKEGRYADMFKAQKLVLQQLQSAQDLAARDASVRVDRASRPGERRNPVLDAPDEPVPLEYYDSVKRYFENLSQGQ